MIHKLVVRNSLPVPILLMIYYISEIRSFKKVSLYYCFELNVQSYSLAGFSERALRNKSVVVYKLKISRITIFFKHPCRQNNAQSASLVSVTTKFVLYNLPFVYT